MRSDLFIVDNSDKHWKAKNYLHEWTDLAHTFDVDHTGAGALAADVKASALQG